MCEHLSSTLLVNLNYTVLSTVVTIFCIRFSDLIQENFMHVKKGERIQGESAMNPPPRLNDF